jgi:hypothetical protein
MYIYHDKSIFNGCFHGLCHKSTKITNTGGGICPIVGRVGKETMSPGGFKRPLPSGNLLQFAIENGHRKFVDLPSYRMVIFQFAHCSFTRG